MSHPEHESWKDKYLATLESLGQETREREQAEKILRQAISRLSLAVDTRDPTFTAELASLRDTVRSGGDPQHIARLMEDISASILRLDRRRTASEAIVAALEAFTSRTHGLHLPAGPRQAARDFKKRLLRASQDADVPAALDASVHFNATLTEWLITPRPERPGLLQRILQRTQTDNTKINDEPAGQDSAPPFNLVLFDLLKRLDLPAVLDPLAMRIGEQLQEPPTAALASAAVGDIADLMAKSRHQIEQEKQDIEQFLAQLTNRLEEIDQLLGDSFGNRERASAEGSVIDANMTAAVDRIHRSVAEAQDIEGLKIAIKLHIENIQTQMRARQELEQTQLKQAEAEAARLRETLAKTENESQTLRARLQDARERALHDTLTGLPNRLAYEQRIEQELARWSRYGRAAVLSIWDVDYFKQINDRFGHLAGDNALKAIARLLEEASRESDFLARFGGEEFMLLLPETDIATALALANRLRERVAGRRFLYRGQPVPLSISCGLAPFMVGDTAETLYQRADTALYRAKAVGRNCCLVFEPSMLSQD